MQRQLDGRAAGVMNLRVGVRFPPSALPPAPRADRLYVVTRKDLPMGLRTAQVAHAVGEWVLLHGRPPENLVVLAVSSRSELERLTLAGRVVRFTEPDLDGELTAIAAGPECWRQLSSLPLLR